MNLITLLVCTLCVTSLQDLPMLPHEDNNIWTKSRKNLPWMDLHRPNLHGYGSLLVGVQLYSSSNLPKLSSFNGLTLAQTCLPNFPKEGGVLFIWLLRLYNQGSSSSPSIHIVLHLFTLCLYKFHLFRIVVNNIIVIALAIIVNNLVVTIKKESNAS